MAFTFSKLLDGVVAWATRYSSFLILLFIVLLIIYLWVRVPSGLPPCPKWVWPAFAHSLMVKGNLIDLFCRLRQEHGDVFSFWLAGQLVIVVNGFQKIKELFVDDGANFAWRPDILNCDLFHYGVICTSGRQWREQRAVTKKALDYSHGAGLNPTIAQEVQAFIKAIDREEQGPIDPRIMAQTAMYSNMCTVLFGHRLDYSDQRLCEGVSHFNDNIKLFSDCRLPNFFPFEKFLIGDTFDTKFLRINMADIYRKLINEETESHLEHKDGDRRQDFVSSYLLSIAQNEEMERKKEEEEEGKEGEKKKPKSKDKESSLNRMNMQAAVYDILWHGTTTTAGAFQWALLYLLHNPDTQARAQDEIDANCEQGNAPLTAEERKKLPYIEAMVLEVFRLANVVPFGMARCPLKEVKFHGYRIPTDAKVVPNLNSVLRDPELFPEPDAFKPERFISASGDVCCPAHFIPFLFGNRSCLGGNIAQDTIFQFLFGVLQKYRLEPAETGKLPPLTRGFQVVSLPKDFKMRFIPRS